MKKLLIASALIVGFTAAPQAFADNHRGGGMFTHADQDGNGEISLDEFKDHNARKSEEWFKKLDADGNGNVTKDEAKAGREHMRDKMKERVKDRADKRKERRGARDAEQTTNE